MCDTVVALGNSTRDGSVLFGKNSDREPNEMQVLEFHPRQYHEKKTVRCTYIEVPQVKETYAVILSRPYWMWGAEMGVNEYGVAIGNEAVFTKEPYSKTGLLGMDLLRLALERSKTAFEALKVVTGLLEKYGQGGACSITNPKFTYHNSFLIADTREAWVLETAGKYWVAEKVKDVRSISNCLTIGENWDLASPGLVEHAVEMGWCKNAEDFNFARCYSSWFYTYFSRGRERHSFTQKALEEKKDSITVEDVMKLLRSHSKGEGYDPAFGSMRDVCMHAGGLTRPSQTVASYVGQLSPTLQVHWFTATSAPCLSVYKPVFFSSGIPDLGEPSGVYSPKSYWWRFEKFHRKAIVNYRSLDGFFDDRDSLESEIMGRVESIKSKARLESREIFSNITRDAFEEAENLASKWEGRLTGGLSLKSLLNPIYMLYWRKYNKTGRIG